MKKNNIESHARSIFLQGILLSKNKFFQKSYLNTKKNLMNMLNF